MLIGKHLKGPPCQGPKGEKRPADVIGNAAHVMRIATGEIEEGAEPDDGKDPSAKALVARAARSRCGSRQRWRPV
jgi:hypothetical protein